MIPIKSVALFLAALTGAAKRRTITMTTVTVTGQLQATAAAQMAQARKEANEQTIDQNMPKVLELLQERIAKLEAENAALRAVAVAWLDAYVEFDAAGNVVMTMEEWRKIGKPAHDALAAGYLPTEGVSS